MHATDGIKRKKRARASGCGTEPDSHTAGSARLGHVPAGKFLISDHLRSLLVPFWG